MVVIPSSRSAVRVDLSARPVRQHWLMSSQLASKRLPPSLFEVRTRTGSRAYTTPTYRVLNERSGPLWERVRTTLDEWFARVPPHARAQIRERFASDKEIVHHGALWELYLHEAFVRLGYDVDLDVGRDSETTSRPPRSTRR